MVQCLPLGSSNKETPVEQTPLILLQFALNVVWFSVQLKEGGGML